MLPFAGILKLPEVDFTKGRLHEILNACRQLKEEGYPVLLELSGCPFTILNGLLPTETLLRAVRKEPVQFAQAWKKMSMFLLAYLERILEYRVDIVSYADPLAGADILGPKRAADFAGAFVYPFLKQAEAQTSKRALILLCPKISDSLVNAGVAVFQERNFKRTLSYGGGLLKFCRDNPVCRRDLQQKGEAAVKKWKHERTKTFIREGLLWERQRKNY